MTPPEPYRSKLLDLPDNKLFHGLTEYVVGFLVRSGQFVALVQKPHPAWQKGLWNGCGGKVEPMESPAVAMQREGREELGFYPELGWQHRITVTFWHKPVVRVHVYVAHDDHRQVNPFASRDAAGNPDEPTAWASLAALPHNLVPNLRWMLPLALDLAIRGPVLLEAAGETGVRGGAGA